MTEAELQAAREAVAAAIEARAQAFAADLADVWRSLERQLPGLIEKANAGSISALVRLARAGRLQQEIRIALDRAGWSQLIDQSTDQALATVLTNVEQLRLAAEIGAFAAGDTTRIEALKALAAVDVLGEGEAVASALWKATVQGVFSSRPVDRILGDLRDLLDHSEPQIRTLYDTSISVFAREAETLGVADDPQRAYAYTGPSDEKVRPFCRAHLGKVYTKDRIDAMDNGQLPNVFLTGGGYNCRHGWTAIAKFSDLARLVNTDERVAGFTRGLAAGGAKAA